MIKLECSNKKKQASQTKTVFSIVKTFNTGIESFCLIFWNEELTLHEKKNTKKKKKWD